MRGIELHCTHIGSRGGDTRAQHLELAPGHTRSLTQTHDEPGRSARSAGRRCLLDHLGVLQEHMTSLGHEARIDTLDQAIEALER